MNFITSIEAEQWVEKTLDMKLTPEALRSRFKTSISYSLPSDTGRKTYLANCISRLVTPQPEGLLWMTSWNVWPSAENMNLFYGYRRSLSESRPLIEVPGHIFQSSELEQVECLLDLALYFMWDAWIIEGKNGVVIKISHDEDLFVYASQKSALSPFESMFQKLELQPA